MIKIDITTRDGVIENHGRITGKRDEVTAEVVSILLELHNIDDGTILTDAFAIMLEEIANDKRKS